jgi:hypothetical protein
LLSEEEDGETIRVHPNINVPITHKAAPHEIMKVEIEHNVRLGQLKSEKFAKSSMAAFLKTIDVDPDSVV